MRKLLNTLHVMTQGAYLHRDGETVAVKVGDELKLRVPVHTLEGLVCWGRVSCSPPVLGLCCERGVGISFLSEQGRFIARVNGPVSRSGAGSGVLGTGVMQSAGLGTVL